jgi:wobble nucleotide-excising tRNase
MKLRAPAESLSPDSDFRVALEAVTTLQHPLQAYNNAVDDCNALINGQKTAVQQGGDINALNRELADLQANSRRFEPEVVKACRDYQDAVNAKTILEEEKARKKELLDQHCLEILRTYELTINAYLDQFHAGFRITNSRHLYIGGTPSSHYQIQINNTAIELGDSRTQAGTPCFKTTLSSGDRSALALAFFLAALTQDTELNDKIVVFDDPFTSQDRFRRTCTQQLIRQIARAACQTVVLSHDPHFLKLLYDSFNLADIKTLQLCGSGNDTMIGEWDIEAETQSTYIKNHSALLDFYRDRTGRPLDVVRAIRPFIEGMLRTHFPGRFQAIEWLGDFISRIRDAGDTDGLSHAKADLPEIEAINDYSKKYHHDTNPNADAEPLSSDELHGFVKRTLRLVGGC